MCKYCNDLVKCKNFAMDIVCLECSIAPPVYRGLCVDCNPLGFNQFYEVVGPSNLPTPLNNSEDCNDTRYENNYWQSQSLEESVGSCDWIVISSDDG